MTDQGVAHPYAVGNATDRFVIVTVGADAPDLRYRYETWVHFMSFRPRPRVDLAALADALTAEDSAAGSWTFDGVDGLSPALHHVGGATTSVTDAEFVTRVTDALRAAASTWSPYPD
jgi:hypothetical protein